MKKECQNSGKIHVFAFRDISSGLSLCVSNLTWCCEKLWNAQQFSGKKLEGREGPQVAIWLNLLILQVRKTEAQKGPGTGGTEQRHKLLEFFLKQIMNSTGPRLTSTL